MRRVAIALLIVLTVWPGVDARAQRLADRSPAIRFDRSAPAGRPGPRIRDTVAIRPTYWLEGGAIGGGIVAAMAGILAVQLCGYDGDPCHNPGLKAVAGLVGGFLFGFGPGAMIGGQFPKPQPITDLPN